MTPQQRKERAYEIINTFAGKKAPGWFTAYSREEVARDIRQRVNDPTGINQQSALLCGPAAFVYALASDQPEKYATLVTELFDDGVTYIHQAHEHWSGIWVRPGMHLKHYRPPGAFQSADWISMAALRDSSNWFLDFGAVDDSIRRAGTGSGDLCTWLNRFGGYQQVIDRTRAFGWKEELLHEAHAHYMSRFRVFLNVNADILNDVNSSWSLRGNHWVVLESPVMIRRETVELKVYTWAYMMSWGRKRDQLSMNKQNFLDHYYGFVAAKY